MVKADKGWMALIGSEAFAVFDGFEVVLLAGSCASFGIDVGLHGDLCVDAAVVAMGFDGLWNQQNRDTEQAEATDDTQHWVGVGSHHLASRELLLAVVDHASLVFGSSVWIALRVDWPRATWLSAKTPTRGMGGFSRNSKLDVIGSGIVEGVMPPPANADHTSLWHSLFALLFTGMVSYMGLDGSTGKLQPELTLTACREQSVDIQPRQSIQQHQC